MGKESDQWQQIVSSYEGAGDVKWEAVGGINPADGPVALCVGGSNRLTGQLAPDFWGASCDADEKEVGGFMRKSLVPTAILAKAHMPDLAKVVPAFNVESVEANAGEFVKHGCAISSRRGTARFAEILAMWATDNPGKDTNMRYECANISAKYPVWATNNTKSGLLKTHPQQVNPWKQ